MAAASFPPYGAKTGELLLLRRMVHSLQVEADKRESELQRLRKAVPWCSVCREETAQVCSQVCNHLAMCRGCYDRLASGGRTFRCPLCTAPTDSTTCFTIYLP